MKKYILPISVLVFSIGIKVYSSYNFTNQTKVELKVRNPETTSSLIPKNAVIISSDSNKDKQITSYTTEFSKDQILSFYETYAKLNGWKKIGERIYRDKDSNIEIAIEKESGDKNLVTVRETK